jgi:hypothetical protein
MAPRRSRHSRLRVEDYLAAVGLFLVVVVALAVFGRGGAGASNRTAGLRCDTTPQLAVHYHAHLDLLYGGRPVPVPAQVGIIRGCRYWLHTNSADGVLHVEGPAAAATHQFTVGDFFWVWGQPLSGRQVAALKLGRGQELKAWLDGRPVAGEVGGLVLHPRDQVVLEVGPPFVPPPRFDWSSASARQEIARIG